MHRVWRVEHRSPALPGMRRLPDDASRTQGFADFVRVVALLEAGATDNSEGDSDAEGPPTGDPPRLIRSPDPDVASITLCALGCHIWTSENCSY